MRSVDTPFRRSGLLGALLIVAVASSCAQPSPRVEPDDLFWPPPPLPPRIKYLKSIYTEDDLGRNYSLREKLFGKSYFDGMVRPYGVSARHGKLLVTDIVMRRVMVFDVGARRLTSVLGQEGAFQLPAAAAVDAEGRFYVADSSSTKVVVYDPSGNYSTSLQIDGGRPVGLAVSDALRRLYVVDREGHRVVVFGLDGTRLFSFGRRGNGDGQFNIPLDVALDVAGRVYVLDSGNFRIQAFTADGAFLSKFGDVGDRPGMLANPKGIALDSDGHVYVTDAAFSNFQLFDAEGSILLFVGAMGPFPGYLHLPAGIAIDEADRIYVADQLNSRVQVFQYLRTAAAATLP